MGTQTIKKSIQIAASPRKVWDVLFSDATFRIWCAEFSEGSHAVTDWKEGSKVVFKDHTGSGLVGNIIKSAPFKELAVEYDCMIVDGQEQPLEDMKGGVESYHLTEKEKGTLLAISSDMSESYMEFMSSAWDKALLKIKELAETK
ncbi:MAG: SRPBCC domain-containing protein [Verrucomicrobiales bacterium]